MKYSGYTICHGNNINLKYASGAVSNIIHYVLLETQTHNRKAAGHGDVYSTNATVERDEDSTQAAVNVAYIHKLQ